MGAGQSQEDFLRGLYQLQDRAVEASDTAFWDKLWNSPMDAEQVFKMTKPSDVRRLIVQQPDNVVGLCVSALARAQVVLQRFHDVTSKAEDVLLALNVLYMLTRLLPFVFETSDPALRQRFWRVDVAEGKDKADAGTAEGKDMTDAGAADGKDKADAGAADGKDKADAGSAEGKDTDDEGKPLGAQLLDAVLGLAFAPGFTVSFKLGGTHRPSDKMAYVWESGVMRAPHGPTPAFDANRAAVLRCLVSMVSSTLYTPVAEVLTRSNPWLGYLTQAVDGSMIGVLVASILGVVCSYKPGSMLPFSYLVTNDKREGLVEVGLQLLVCLLDHQSTQGRAEAEGRVDPAACNAARAAVRRLDQREQFQMLAESLVRIIHNPIDVTNTYLPNYHTRPMLFYQEAALLLWQLAEHNPGFLQHFLASDLVCKVITSLVYLILTNRENNAHSGIIHCCVFLLLLLSGERDFCTALNKPYEEGMSLDLPVFYGNHADLVFLALHKLMVSGQGMGLFDCMLTIMVNVSPYIRSLCSTTAVKLGNLFEMFTAPRFLFAHQFNHRFAVFLLELFNNIVQYQFEGNPQLVYTLVRRAPAFVKLAALTLDDVPKARPRRRSSTQARQLYDDIDNKQGEGEPPADVQAAAPPGDSSASASASAAAGDTTTATTSTTAAAADAVPAARRQASVSSAGSRGRPTAVQLAGSLGDVDRHTTVSPAGSRSADDTAVPVAVETPSPTGVHTAPGHAPDGVPHPDEPVFMPTDEWLQAWKSKLPIYTILRLLEVLEPKINAFCESRTKVDESDIIAFIRESQLIGLLPVPHAIIVRRYTPNDATWSWFTTYLWGLMYIRCQSPPWFYGTGAKLFTVRLVES